MKLQVKIIEDIFEIAGILLLDRDNMVQKGYGWMPRTALRYAIEKMPADLRARALAKS